MSLIRRKTENPKPFFDNPMRYNRIYGEGHKIFYKCGLCKQPLFRDKKSQNLTGSQIDGIVERRDNKIRKHWNLEHENELVLSVFKDEQPYYGYWSNNCSQNQR